MKTLKQTILDNYLKQGSEPRVFIRIPDANLFYGTKSHAEFSDNLGTMGTISQSIDKYGGMAHVSGVELTARLEGERLTLCSEASLAPLSQGIVPGAGRLLRSGGVDDDYVFLRNSTTASSFAGVAIVAGRAYDATGAYYTNYRGFYQTRLPLGLSTCEDAYITVTGVSSAIAQAFGLVIVEGNWTALGSDGVGIPGVYNDFEGWQASGVYPVTALNESFLSSEFTMSDTMIIRLNETARDLIVSIASTTRVLRMMFLSSLDVSNAAAPTGYEFMSFDASSIRLNLRYNSIDLDNKEAQVYLCYEPPPSSYTDMQRVWTGVADDSSVTDSEHSLSLRQNDFKKNRKIPARVITLDEFPDCPDDNIGKPYPVVYGRAYPDTLGLHRAGVARKSGDPVSGLRGYWPSPVVNVGDADYENQMRVLVSGGAIASSLDGVPAIWDSGLKMFVELWAQVSSDKGDDYRYVDLSPKKRVLGGHKNTAVPVAEEDYFGLAYSIMPSIVYDSSEVADPENAYSETNAAAYAEFTTLNGTVDYAFPKLGLSGAIDKAEVVFDLVDDHSPASNEMRLQIFNKQREIDVEGTDGVTVWNGVLQRFTSATAQFQTNGVVDDDWLVIIDANNDAARYKIYSVDSESQLTLYYTGGEIPDATGLGFKIMAALGSAVQSEGVIYGSGRRVIDVSSSVDWNIDQLIFRIDISTAFTPYQPFQVSNFHVRFFTSGRDSLTTVYTDKRGARDDASGTITGTPYQLLENPAHIITDLVQTEMLLTSADIDLTALSAAADELASWTNIFHPDQRREAMDVLHDFFVQCRSKGYWDEQDRLTMKVFDAAAHFPVSGTDAPADLDIFEYSGSPSGGSITRHVIMPDSFSLGQVGMDEVYNDVVLQYGLNPASGEYTGCLTCSADDTNVDDGDLENGVTGADLVAMCAESQTAYGTVNTLEFKADLIRDEATAAKLLQYFVERRSRRRRIVSLTTKMSALIYDFGDFANIRVRRIYDLYGTAVTERKKWEVIRKDINLFACTIAMQFLEV